MCDSGQFPQLRLRGEQSAPGVSRSQDMGLSLSPLVRGGYCTEQVEGAMNVYPKLYSP